MERILKSLTIAVINTAAVAFIGAAVITAGELSTHGQFFDQVVQFFGF